MCRKNQTECSRSLSPLLSFFPTNSSNSIAFSLFDIVVAFDLMCVCCTLYAFCCFSFFFFLVVAGLICLSRLHSHPLLFNSHPLTLIVFVEQLSSFALLNCSKPSFSSNRSSCLQQFFICSTISIVRSVCTYCWECMERALTRDHCSQFRLLSAHATKIV